MDRTAKKQGFQANHRSVETKSRSAKFSARYEGSDEFADQPSKQYGVSVAWRPVDRIGLIAEYLHGNYKNNFVFDDENNELDDRDLFAAQLTIEF